MEMLGTDWTKCWGEVFRIYRHDGPGHVYNGDRVALYYPRQRGRWLGCSGSKCKIAKCPGIPHHIYGFADTSKWSRCYGEVFQIYTKNKGNSQL